MKRNGDKPKNDPPNKENPINASQFRKQVNHKRNNKWHEPNPKTT